LLCWVLELCMVVVALFIKRGESLFRQNEGVRSNEEFTQRL
jgi:hypothetical protein